MDSYLSQFVNEIRDYAIILMDPMGLIQNWNSGAERIKGYRPEEVIGKHFSIFYTMDDQLKGKPCQLIELARKEGQAYDEGWRVRKDNSKFWGSITITAIHDTDGSIVGFGKVTRDLTDRKQAEEARLNYLEELELKNKELEQFAHIAAHDLQEPLGTIKSFVQVIRDEYGDKLDENAHIYFDFLSKASGRMQELIKGLLEYSKIGKGKESGIVDIKQLLIRLLKELKPSIRASGAHIILQDMPVIRGYAKELNLLFLHLIGNALKFRKKDIAPVIIIRAIETGDGWLFSISDNGIGIECKNKDKIFTIFKRMNNRDEYAGEGIGLSYCKKIVELHGGTIWVESIPDKGSIFKFKIIQR